MHPFGPSLLDEEHELQEEKQTVAARSSFKATSHGCFVRSLNIATYSVG